MSAIRLPLLYAFAGGVLSSAVLFGVWQAGAESGAAAVRQQQRAHHAELVSAVPSTPSDEQRRAETSASLVVDRAANTTAEPAAPQAAPDPDGAGPTAAGSAAVSEVLTRLERAYRERVASTAATSPSSTGARALTSPPPDSAAPEAPPDPPVAAVAPTEPPPVVVASAPLASAPVVPAVAAPVAVAPAEPPLAAAPVSAAALPAPPTKPPPYAAAPTFAPPDAPPPAEIHYGDVNQNTYITNVRQGDTYLIQVQQQLAMMQYMQLLGASSGAAARARNGGRGIPAQPTRFPSAITNPDNPWGFNFKPPHLVH